MHGYNSGSDVVVNAEGDSMGGVADGGVGVGIKTSPRRAAIEKAQAELRQEYDVREERRRELEFLEKGGNPLDFKFGNAASLSVQSTSLTDHHTEHQFNSEAKGSFALNASPRGDSVESIGRPGALTICEANTADNFDGENQSFVGQKRFKNTCRRSTAPRAEVPNQIDVLKNVKESDDSAIFRPYARRNRSKPNRDGTRTSADDIVQASSVLGSSSVNSVVRDTKGNMFENNDQKNQNTISNSIPKFPTPNGDSVTHVEPTGDQVKTELIADGNTSCSPNDDLSRNKFSEYEMAKDFQNNPLQNDHYALLNDAGSSEGNHFEGKDNVVSTETLTCEVRKGDDMEAGCSHLVMDDNKLDANECMEIGLTFGSKDAESSCTAKNLSVDAKNCVGNHGSDDVSCSSRKHVSDLKTLPDGTSNCVGNEDNCDAMASAAHSAMNRLAESEVDTREEKMIQSELTKTIDGVNRGSASVIQASQGVAPENINECALPQGNSAPLSELKCDHGFDAKALEKERDDSILEEARTIEAKRKRIAELSVASPSFERRAKSQWDFVLEEMAWLAYDFSQERVWKMTAAGQICRRVALSSRLRTVEQSEYDFQKKLACTLANAVMQFWHSIDVVKNGDNAILESRNQDFEGVEPSKINLCQLDQEKDSNLPENNLRRAKNSTIMDYAARFLAYNCSSASSIPAEAPKTPDKVVEPSWIDHLTEESLFYAIPVGSMQIYRGSIESYVMQLEKTCNSLPQEEVDTSMHSSMADLFNPDAEFAEEEGETSTYYMHGGLESSKLTKHDQKKLRNNGRAFSVRSYKQGSEMIVGNAMAPQQNITLSRKSANNYSVGPILPKRSRTASRQRLVGHVNPGFTAPLQFSTKADASSGDTNSFQDDQSTLHGSSQLQRSVEVESGGDFDKQLAYDFTDATKPRKKKKTKHLDSAYDQMWKLDSITPNDNQKGSSKNRSENLMYDSNGTSGLYGQSAAKKPKLIKQTTDGTFDNVAPVSGSIPSPAASQMSNMSNTNKFVKMFNGRERVRKSKVFKISSGQSDSGSPWSLFEDQALVVLVHDMGPNWELVSDAINNTLQFKCIFRNPKECKERHKILMDKGAGDGADSAEDSGSSQSYPSTLPGIPKGSARQLFQRLQGPVEEDTLKSHFEMIIMIEKKLHSRRNQNDHRDGMQHVPTHNSHMMALSQVCPNNLNGGILTPLDLSESNTASSDVMSLGFHGSHANLVHPSQPSNSQTPTSAANSCLPSSSGVAHSNSSQPASIQPNSSVRYNVIRAPIPVDEQHRFQHYNQMLSARNMQQPNLSVPATDRGGVRLLSGGNSMSMMPGVKRNGPMPRPGLQAMSSSPMMNSGAVVTPSLIGVQNPANLHSNSGSSSGNAMIRPREPSHLMRPGHTEHQRQAINQEHQVQNNGQGVSSFSGMSSAFTDQSVPPPAPTYAAHPSYHHQQPHVLGNSHHPSSQQQAFAIRLAKERQLQQQRLIQQQQQFANSGTVMTHAQSQSQLPLNTPIQPQASSHVVSAPPAAPSSPLNTASVSHQQQKHNGVGRGLQGGASGPANPGGKARNRQPSQQQQAHHSGRSHPQPRQHSQSPQNPKLTKGLGRGNMMVHPNVADHSHLNGLSLAQGAQASDKGDQAMNVQSQGMYSTPVMGGAQSSKAVASPQKHQSSSTSLQKQASLPNPENSQSQVLSANSGHGLSPSHQAVSSPGMVPTSHLQPHIQQKQMGQPLQNVQRGAQPIYKMGCDQNHMDHEIPGDISMAGNSNASGMQSFCNDSIAGSSVSPGVPQQWSNSESLLESVVPNPGAQAGAPPAGNEVVAPLSHDVNQRQVSGNIGMAKVVPSPQLFHLPDQQLQQDHQSPRKQ